ncbi:MAG TPA: hypothetical protein VI341_05040 [Actinomycetota bacterium]
MSDERSPWPEDQQPQDQQPQDLPPEGQQPQDLPPEGQQPALPAFADEWDDEPEEPAGSKGVAITVALGTFGFWVVLPVLVVVGVYSMLTVYAIVKAVGSAPEQPNALAIALGIVGLITLFVVIIAVAISLIGRTANPKRRH